MVIKNIVFDIGNVLVRWSPDHIIKTIFPNHPHQDELLQKIFKSETWFDLNLGKITQEEAIDLYHTNVSLDKQTLAKLMEYIKESQIPLEGSFELLETFYKSGWSLYSITDNIKEIVEHLKKKYTFWNRFKGVVVSANIGVLKPDPLIYQHLLKTYNLVPEETLFFDDLLKNVEGAKSVGMHALQFTTAEKCKVDLKNNFNISV